MKKALVGSTEPMLAGCVYWSAYHVIMYGGRRIRFSPGRDLEPGFCTSPRALMTSTSSWPFFSIIPIWMSPGNTHRMTGLMPQDRINVVQSCKQEQEELSTVVLMTAQPIEIYIYYGVFLHVYEVQRINYEGLILMLNMKWYFLYPRKSIQLYLIVISDMKFQPQIVFGILCWSRGSENIHF